MRDGSGRQNSRAFDRGRGGLNIIVPSPIPLIPFAGFNSPAYHNFVDTVPAATVSQWNELERLTPPRAIGRLGDHAIRERPEDCAVGDAVAGGYFPDNSEILFAQCFPRSPDDTTRYIGEVSTAWTFECVRMRVTADDGRTWHDEHLWKRIE